MAGLWHRFGTITGLTVEPEGTTGEGEGEGLDSIGDGKDAGVGDGTGTDDIGMGLVGCGGGGGLVGCGGGGGAAATGAAVTARFIPAGGGVVIWKAAST